MTDYYIGVSSAASHVPALYQGDPTLGWDSPQQYHAWWPSACSAVALTAELRGWGTQVGVGAVLDQLWNLGAISVESGLTDATALARVAEQYGYQASLFWHWSAQAVAQVTAQGVLYGFGSPAEAGFLILVMTPLAWLQQNNEASLIGLQPLPFCPRLRSTAAHHPKGGICVMEAELVAQRCALFSLSRRHPEWTYALAGRNRGPLGELGQHVVGPLETRDRS